MSRDLWTADTTEDYGMAYTFHIDPDGTLWSEESRPVVEDVYGDEDAYDWDGDR